MLSSSCDGCVCEGPIRRVAHPARWQPSRDGAVTSGETVFDVKMSYRWAMQSGQPIGGGGVEEVCVFFFFWRQTTMAARACVPLARAVEGVDEGCCFGVSAGWRDAVVKGWPTKRPSREDEEDDGGKKKERVGGRGRGRGNNGLFRWAVDERGRRWTL
jgi:hypothetical protein